MKEKLQWKIRASGFADSTHLARKLRSFVVQMAMCTYKELHKRALKRSKMI